MFFCLLKPNLSVTCISGTTSQAIFTSTFTYGAYTNPMVNKMKYGSISSKLYLMGSINNAQYTFFRKVGSDDTSVWTTLTQSQFESHSFDIDYTETYAYSLLGTSSTITIARLLTSDGSIDFAKEFSGASIQIADFYALSCSSSSQTVFYSVADAILFTLYLCRWQDGGTTSDCYQYNSNKPAIAITTIDSNVSYFASVSTPIGNLEFRKVDFSQTNINIWLSSITCSSCTSYTGADGILYDSSSSSVYFLVIFNNSVYFIQLSSSSGSLTAQYKGSVGTCSFASDLYKYSTSIYLAFICNNFSYTINYLFDISCNGRNIGC